MQLRILLIHRNCALCFLLGDSSLICTSLVGQCFPIHLRLIHPEPNQVHLSRGLPCPVVLLPSCLSISTGASCTGALDLRLPVLGGNFLATEPRCFPAHSVPSEPAYISLECSFPSDLAFNCLICSLPANSKESLQLMPSRHLLR